MTDSSPTNQPPGSEAASLGQEVGGLLLAPKINTVRLHQAVERLQQLGHEHRIAALAEIRKKAKENPTHPLALQLDGPPSRKYLANVKLLKEAAVNSHVDNKAELEKLEKKLKELTDFASQRQRLIAHMLPVGAPLINPQLLGQRIEKFAHSKHAPRASLYADWLGADLSRKNLDGANFQGAFLDGANLEGTSLIGANLKNVTLVGANLSNAVFTGANLKGANLGGANLTNTKLDKANLNEVIFDKAFLDGADCQGSNMIETTFMGIQAISANFSEANLKRSKWLGINKDADLEEISKSLNIDKAISPIDIGGINFTGANLSFAIMLGCVANDGIKMSKVNLRKASLQRCSFVKADFSYAQFANTNVVMETSIRQSNFTNAIMTASFFRGADLSQSSFHLARLDKSNFSLTNMTNCSAIQISGSATHFERANLTNATFLSSKLVGGIFRNANLSGTCFDDCDLTHSDFSKSTITESTAFINANLSRALLPSSSKK